MARGRKKKSECSVVLFDSKEVRVSRDDLNYILREKRTGKESFYGTLGGVFSAIFRKAPGSFENAEDVVKNIRAFEEFVQKTTAEVDGRVKQLMGKE